MLPKLDSPEVIERYSQSDGAMAAHAKVTSVVEEDYARCTGRIDRLTEQSSDYRIEGTWFIDRKLPKVIRLVTKTAKPMCK